MALKFSEMTALRVDLSRNLEAGFDNYLEDVATGFDRFVAPLLEEGETAPDVGFQLELLKRGVVRSRRRLTGFDSPLLDQTHEEAKVRAAIEQRQDAVDEKLRQVRHVCRGLFGDKAVARVGLQEEPPNGVPRLLGHAKTVQMSLENPDLGLEPLLELDFGEGAEAPTAQLAAQLEPELSQLDELVGDRHDENRKGADVRWRRQQALEEFDREVRAIVRTAQGLFRLAGRDDPGRALPSAPQADLAPHQEVGT